MSPEEVRKIIDMTIKSSMEHKTAQELTEIELQETLDKLVKAMLGSQWMLANFKLDGATATYEIVEVRP